MTERDGRAADETTETDAEEAADAAAAGLEPVEGEDEAAAAAEEADFEDAAAREAGFDQTDLLEEEPARVGAPGRVEAAPGRRPARRGPAAPDRAPSLSEIAVHIDDRISKVFVIAVTAVFALIFLNALLLGKGGLFSPVPAPTPVPSATAAPSATPAPSLTAAPSGSPGASATPAASATPVASASATP